MTKLQRFLALPTLLCGFALPAMAGNISALGALTQSEFRTVSEDMGSAFSYKPVSPTAALGLTGFDIGFELTSTDVSRSAAILTKAGVNTTSFDSLYIPRLHLHKGLPFGFDVAAFVGNVPVLNAQLVGGELRYALIDGGIVSPAVGLRLAGTQLNGVDNLSVKTRSVDLSISKGFAILSPYAGVGQVWVDSTPSAGTLVGESFTQGKVFAGLNLNAGLVNFAFEGDRTGSATSWSIKMGLRW